MAIPYCVELEWRATCPRCAEQHTAGYQIECGGVRITQEELVIKLNHSAQERNPGDTSLTRSLADGGGRTRWYLSLAPGAA